MPSGTTIPAGFEDPVHHAQASFRHILEAMAHPGRIHDLPCAQQAVAGLQAASAAIALTLADFETPVWLAPGCHAAADFLRFHCGCPLVADPREASFAFASNWDECPPLADFDLGDDDEPARSTTLVVAVDRLQPDGSLVLRGPGIAHHHLLEPSALPAHRLAQRAALSALFPRGLDLILAHGAQICALPRTTRITTLMEPQCMSL